MFPYAASLNVLVLKPYAANERKNIESSVMIKIINGCLKFLSLMNEYISKIMIVTKKGTMAVYFVMRERKENIMKRVKYVLRNFLLSWWRMKSIAGMAARNISKVTGVSVVTRLLCAMKVGLMARNRVETIAATGPKSFKII
jgi:hypothetical protein